MEGLSDFNRSQTVMVQQLRQNISKVQLLFEVLLLCSGQDQSEVVHGGRSSEQATGSWANKAH